MDADTMEALGGQFELRESSGSAGNAGGAKFCGGGLWEMLDICTSSRESVVCLASKFRNFLVFELAKRDKCSIQASWNTYNDAIWYSILNIY